MKIKELRYVPYPVAYKLLAEAVRRSRRVAGTSALGPQQSSPVPDTLNYLREFSKCTADQAEEAVKRLTDLGLSEFAAVMLVNIRPLTVYEVKAILGAARTGLTLSEEELAKIVEILDETCGRPS